jgi:hypothetical protein
MVIFVTERVAPQLFAVERRTTAMLTYYELVDLARLCAYNSRITTDREVARVLWQMANEYQAKAAKLTAGPGSDHGACANRGTMRLATARLNVAA